MNQIIDGTSVGHYYLLLGPKGVGKTSMIIDAMRRNQGDRVSMFEAHGDTEIFRIRLGKALDYEFHEEYASDQRCPIYFCHPYTDSHAVTLEVCLASEAHGIQQLYLISSGHSIN